MNSDYKNVLLNKFSGFKLKALSESTKLDESEFLNKYPDKPFDGACFLPDGEIAFICTNSANYVVSQLGEGIVCGFYVEDNPVEDIEISSVGGHDFAVIRGRYIVDLWIMHYAGTRDKCVFDMNDKNDKSIIKELYGDPDKWSVYDPKTNKAWEAQDVPDLYKVKLGVRRVHNSDLSLGMSP
jgi:hypothetical protein